MIDQATYEAEKARLKLERDTQSEIHRGWRECPICSEAWRTNIKCDVHREAGMRAQKARDDLKAFFDQHCPPNRRPPTRYETMRNRLARHGRTPVWE